MAGNGRIAIAFGFIGLMVAALVWLLLTDRDSEPEAVPTTQLTVAPATTTTAITTTTTSVPDATTTSLDPDARLVEVARILEDLEIAWYDAVYRKDESVLPEIVATRSFYDAAVDAMEVADFAGAPSDDTVDVNVYDILLDREDCLVVHFELDLRGLIPDVEPRDGVQSLWPTDNGGYRLVRLWAGPGDLWIEDCDSLNRDEVP